MSHKNGSLAFVLHAHLPWVLSRSGDISLEERWFHDALWESYLPLLGMCESLTQLTPARPRLTLSLSPTLIAMLRDPAARERFRGYTAELEKRFADAGRAAPTLSTGIEDHLLRLRSSMQCFDRHGGDVVAAFVRLEDAGVLELGTTAATHAFLPGLRTEESVRAQLRMGLRYFQAVTRRAPRALWLPECGYDEKLERCIVGSGASYSVLSAHALELARPRPPHGTLFPIVGQSPFAFFGRASQLVDRIWSRERGYPADVSYREFYRPLSAQDGAESVSAHSPLGTLKPFRVTGHDAQKQPYEPAVARTRVRQHAQDFVREATQALAASPVADAVAVAAFDAELFGHWWWEGPEFLANVFSLLEERADGPRATSLGGYLEQDPLLPVARPATSTWGRGGYADVWTHPDSSHAARVVHRAEKRILQVDALVRDNPRTQTQRLSRLWAIRELFLLQASDYAFMLRTGEFAAYAGRKLHEHAEAIDQLARVAERPREADEDRPWLERWMAQRPIFTELDEDAWADVFDPW